MPEGSVSDLLRNPKASISLLQKLSICRDASLGVIVCVCLLLIVLSPGHREGMNWLHTRNPTILHRDLKPANLLMDKDWNVKVVSSCARTVFSLSTCHHPPPHTRPLV
jgi:serine/threonine protein kinase